MTILCTLSACSSTPRSAMRPGTDFSKFKSIQVRAKDNLAPLVSRELLFIGVSPVSKIGKRAKADAVLKVAVTRRNPEKRYIVRTRKRSLAQQTSTTKAGETTTTSVQFEEEPGHDPVEVSSDLAFESTVLGSQDSRLLATYAQVALAGELIAPKSGDILWAGSYSYEGVDLDVALEGAVRGLISEIPW